MKKMIVCLLMLSVVLQMFGAGVLCLTFDDRHFANWCSAIDIFAKYDAKVTFFVCGKIDETALNAMKKLQAAGHSIGLHSFNHAKAVDTSRQLGEEAYLKKEILPQLEVCRNNGIVIRSFAYPNSQRNAATDRILFKKFDYLRYNTGKVLAKDGVLAEANGFFCYEVGGKQLFPGYSLGGNFDMQAIKNAMARAAKENAVIVFYAHNITPEMAKSHHISVAQLEEILSCAKQLQMQIKGLNNL